MFQSEAIVRRVRPGARRSLGKATGRRMGLAAIVAGVLVATPVPGVAQQRIAPVDALRQIQSISPRSGPIGTPVQVYSDNMPLEASFHVGVGATRSGFEALYEATQLDLGEIAVTLPIPTAVTHDRAIVFVAFNAVFSPIAMSLPFHVTDERGRLQRTGEVTGREGGCVTFLDLDRFRYELVGLTDGLSSGDAVIVEAEYVGDSACVDGTTLRVLAVRAAP